ncbi:MAG: anti-repressor SinI family protein [Bacillota bacterium]|nr:anti-repressor SinI family protein [Bacillota bacterium]
MDVEWVALILEAKKLGISKETVRNFLSQHGMKEYIINNSENTY